MDMSIHPGQLRSEIVRPALIALDLYSESVEELLMLTCAQESRCGYYLHQVGGPALGIWQMEPATHDDCWANYLDYHDDLASKVKAYGSTCRDLVGSLYYACAMARIKYLRVPEALPAANNLNDLASYYKRHYNTLGGAATVESAITAYHRYAVVDA